MSASGVAPPVVGRLHLPAADIDRSEGLEGVAGRDDLHPLDFVEARLGHPLAGVPAVLIGVVPQGPPARPVSPDCRLGECRVTEDVVPVPVGVDDPPHRSAGEGTEFPGQLGGRLMALAGIDQQDAVLPDHHPDVQPEKREQASEHTFGQFLEHRA